MYLHQTEKTSTNDETGRVTVLVETEDFAFTAEEQADKTINTYVEWGDDMGGDMANHEDWNDVKRWLNTLFQVSKN